MIFALYIFFIFLTATLYALLEIQIEGRNGWARRLPTWRITNSFTRWFGQDRCITGYHFYFFLLFLVLAHFPFVFITWTLKTEFLILSYLLLFSPLEDFLWFVFNPSYGLGRFNNKYVFWHRWVLGLPVDYWIEVPIGLVLLLLSL